MESLVPIAARGQQRFDVWREGGMVSILPIQAYLYGIRLPWGKTTMKSFKPIAARAHQYLDDSWDGEHDSRRSLLTWCTAASADDQGGELQAHLSPHSALLPGTSGW